MADNEIISAIATGLRAPTGSIRQRAARVIDTLRDAGYDVLRVTPSDELEPRFPRDVDPPVANSATAETGYLRSVRDALAFGKSQKPSEAALRADHLARCSVCRDREAGSGRLAAAWVPRRVVESAEFSLGPIPDRCPKCGLTRDIEGHPDRVTDVQWRREIASCTNLPVTEERTTSPSGDPRGPGPYSQELTQEASDRILAALTTWVCDRCADEAVGTFKPPETWTRVTFSDSDTLVLDFCPPCAISLARWLARG